METNYAKGHDYEFFIRHARLCDRGEHGAHNQIMANLLDKEEGQSHVNHLNHTQLFNEVKNNMLTAIEYAITKRKEISPSDKDVLKSYVPAINAADSAAMSLLTICSEGKELLRKYMPT